MKVKVDFFDGGYCYHPEFMAIKGGSREAVKFPALCAMITHPQLGKVLFDTGYSEHFHEATKKMPYKIYAKMTPVKIGPEDKLCSKIKKLGVAAEEVGHVVLSHFHADHVGGLKDYPKAKFIYTKSSYASVRGTKGLKALAKGYLPGLMPGDFEERSTPIGETELLEDHFLLEYFPKVYDLFGDRSVVGVELPGHAKGQLGLYLETEQRSYLLIADACYLSETYEKLVYPNELVHLINDDRGEYIDTIKRIHKLYKKREDITIVPSHCGKRFKELVSEINWDVSDLNACKK